MLISRRSPITGKARALDINVSQADYDAWEDGVLIQQAMPYISDGEREFILTGIDPAEWDTIFND